MSNNEMDKLVSKRILAAKILGLVMAIGSSLSIGSEGPLIHTAACVAYLLMKFIPGIIKLNITITIIIFTFYRIWRDIRFIIFN